MNDIGSDFAEEFRIRLSEKLRAAMASRDKEAISTIRSIMSAVDNAGAVSQETIAQRLDSSITEMARRKLSKRDLEEILQAEIDARSKAADDYERLGNTVQSSQLRRSIEMIRQLRELLSWEMFIR